MLPWTYDVVVVSRAGLCVSVSWAFDTLEGVVCFLGALDDPARGSGVVDDPARGSGVVDGILGDDDDTNDTSFGLPETESSSD